MSLNPSYYEDTCRHEFGTCCGELCALPEVFICSNMHYKEIWKAVPSTSLRLYSVPAAAER